MAMRCLFVVLLLLPLSQHATAQQTASSSAGDPERGKILWLETEHVECRECHGVDGEGGFGPDLAGRNLTPAQFIHAVRKPWGIMPEFSEASISDQELIDLIALFDSLPSVDEPGPWRREVPAGASRGLAVATTAGCAQCHHPRFNNGRAVMGAINANFDWFKTIIYAHTAAYPATRARLGEPQFERLAMGNFSPTRLPESMVQDIWTYIVDLGFRAKMLGQLSAGAASTDGVVYSLDVTNTGLEGIGLTAEDVTVTLIVPTGSTVVTASGAGYQGVRRDAEAKADVAVWKVVRMAPGDHQTYSLTLSQAGTEADNLRGTIRWMKPTVSYAPSDSQIIAAAPLGAGQVQSH
jgi:mono/diheme cytochrome c family protein